MMNNPQPTDITLTSFQHLEKAGLYFLHCEIDEHRLTPPSRYGDKPYINQYYNIQGKVVLNNDEYPIEIKNPVLVKLGPSEIDMGKIILNINKPSFDMNVFNSLKGARIILM